MQAGRIVFVVAMIAPLVLLQGAPDLAPRWFGDELAGVPVIIWLAILWFALLVFASWIPFGEDDPA